MSYKAIYAYAWDLAEIGRGSAAAALSRPRSRHRHHRRQLSRRQVPATAWPHRQGLFPGGRHRLFRADGALYGAIKPIVSRIARERDVLRELCESGAIGVNVWLVLLHNTKLGEAHPEARVTNAFGDRYVYNLCPAAPAARDYALGLCQDVTEQLSGARPLAGDAGLLPYAHGFHHEFALIKSNRWLDNQLGLCFCAHCVKGAAQPASTPRR